MQRRYTLRFILLIFLVSIFVSTSAQKLTYKILLNNKVIGTLTGERIIQKENVNFLMQSDMTIRKIVEIKIDYKIESSFTNGKLMKSSVNQKTNHKTRSNTITKWNGLQYNVETISDHFVLKSKSIEHNMSTIYYTEPIGLTEIYSDAFGKFLNIRSVSNHRYEVTLPDGKKTFYNYASGICTQVESDQWFSKIIFRLTR